MSTERQEDVAARIDREIQWEVTAELEWDPRIRSEEIAVLVRNGVVTLTGWVDAFAQRWAAEEAAHRVRGVRAVANDLDVRLPIDSVRTDPEIATAAVRALDANALLKADDIDVTVSSGIIVLKGVVDWGYQKSAAEEAVRGLWGVQGVTNQLTVRNRQAVPDLRAQVETALTRNVDVDAATIEVHAGDSAIVLEGSVRSWTEREEAERIAWAAPGVTSVTNHLVVRSG